jgi:N-acetyl-gamma-glutamyl-phosphate reductase
MVEMLMEFYITLQGDADVVFLCLGHGLSREFMSKTTLKEGCKVIDLGNDFRLDEKFDSKNFVYGLCELNKKEIEGAENIANPGCFATAIQLGILPLLSNKVELEDIHITALTGSTGAGKKPSETTHFSYRDSNISIYKLFSHQHLSEINPRFVDEIYIDIFLRKLKHLFFLQRCDTLLKCHFFDFR